MRPLLSDFAEKGRAHFVVSCRRIMSLFVVVICRFLLSQHVAIYRRIMSFHAVGICNILPSKLVIIRRRDLPFSAAYSFCCLAAGVFSHR